MTLSAFAARKLAQQKLAATFDAQNEVANIPVLADTQPAPRITGNDAVEPSRRPRKRNRPSPDLSQRPVSSKSQTHGITTSQPFSVPLERGDRSSGLGSENVQTTPHGTTNVTNASEENAMELDASQSQNVTLNSSNDESDYGPSPRSDSFEPEPPRYTLYHLSSVRREAIEFRRLQQLHAAVVHLRPGEKVVAVGQYDLWVRKGTITIYGSVIHASSKSYRIYAPSSHPLPVLVAVQNPFGGDGTSEVLLCSVQNGLRMLKTLHPSFEKLWNDPAPASDHRSFRILWSSDEDSCERPLHPFEEPHAWKGLAATLVSNENAKRPVVLVCGPKGTGKTTLTRFLTNVLLSNQKYQGVAYMDVDPGQPEYSPPGELSLCILKHHNLGPSYCHPMNGNANGSVSRAHFFGSITPRDDPEHYQRCVNDLYHEYQRSHASFPLVINCSGWILGTGLEVLEALITSIRPSEVVYTSNAGPDEVMETLGRCTKMTNARLLTLESSSGNVGQRTSAELRSMLTMSYFHSRSIGPGLDRYWSVTPVDEANYLDLSYAGERHLIDGITLYSNFIQPEYLEYVLDMAVASIVAIYNDPALKAVLAAEDEVAPTRAFVPEENTWNEAPADPHCPHHESEEPEYSYQGPPAGIMRRTAQGLPYWFPSSASFTPFDPADSVTLGQVLVHGIDAERHCLRVVTPVNVSFIQEHKSKGATIMLVKGKLDRPEWAHFEPYHVGLWREREYEKWRLLAEEAGCKDVGENRVQDWDDNMEFNIAQWAARTPWISMITDQEQDLRRKQKVWKVRRNLETSDGKK